MQKLIIIMMLGSLFSEEPIVTIIGKSGIHTGTIKKYEDGKIIIDSKKGEIGGNITIDGGRTHFDVKDVLLIDYGIKTVYSEA